MNNDISDMLQNFSKMMNNQEMPENIKNILNSMNNNNGNSNSTSCNNNNNGNSNSYNNNINGNNNGYNNSNSHGNNNGCNNSNSSVNNNSKCNNKYDQNNTSGCSSNNNYQSNENTSTSQNSQNNIFGDIDINTILKLQKIMNSINNDKQNDSRANLLKSLKPYLKESRKNKVDQYIQLMKMGKVFEIMNPLGGDEKHV